MFVYNDFIEECRTDIVDSGKLAEIYKIALIGSKMEYEFYSRQGFLKVASFAHIPNNKLYITGDIIWLSSLRVYRRLKAVNDSNRVTLLQKHIYSMRTDKPGTAGY